MNGDYLIVGAGFFGATVARRLAEAGHKTMVIEKRDHIGGNCYSEVDQETGIECHKYGSHIFHTSNEKVWSFISRFTQFNDYRHTVWSRYQDRTYSLPINLSTINAFYNKNLRPNEVYAFLKKETTKERSEEPSNLEEKAISLIGRPLYEAFIKGYTIKQWEKDPTELSPDIITRLPVRYNYNNRYFNDKYEGIPLDGYTSLFERLLDHPNIEVQLNTDYFIPENVYESFPTIYSGPIDRFFDYKYGNLDWRTIDFTKKSYNIPDYQGCTVMNYADVTVPYTRIHEFKHYHPERKGTQDTVIYKEYSRIADGHDDPYYPVNTPRNKKLIKRYREETTKLDNIWPGGRLGSYRYFDMDDTIANALKLAESLLRPQT